MATVDLSAAPATPPADFGTLEGLPRRLALTLAEPGVLGAIGLLAKASLAVDLDVTVDGTRAKAWHRHTGSAVATLATADGLVFELAWFEPAQWAGELARGAAVPE